MTRALYMDSMGNVPNDPDAALVAKYIGGLLTSAQAEAFEDRLAVDEALYQRMGPFLEAWLSAKPLPAEVEILRTLNGARSVTRRRAMRNHMGIAAAAAAVLAFLIVKTPHDDARTQPDRMTTQVAPPTAVSPNEPAVDAPTATAPVVTHLASKTVHHRDTAVTPVVAPVTEPVVDLVTDSMGGFGFARSVETASVDIGSPNLPIPTLKRDSTELRVQQKITEMIRRGQTLNADGPVEVHRGLLPRIIGKLFPTGILPNKPPIKP